jgi:hypothetical protein
MKLKWLFLIVILSYTFFSPFESSQEIELNLKFFSLNYYPSGLNIALMMITRIALMIMTSLWVRLSMNQESFINSLKTLRIPESIAIVIDLTLSQLMTEKKLNKKRKKHKKKITFNEFKSNKSHFLNKLIENNIQKSDQLLTKNYPQILKVQRQDILVILSVVVAIMSLKFLQMMPGLPIAPGHKNLLVIPLLILASLSTNMKYGGLAAGFATGIVSFMMGFGKFGIFEILHFALPGLVSDWCLPFIQGHHSKFLILKLAIIGALLGFTRFVANLGILLLVGAPKLAVLVMMPMLISQVVFGALSSLVCIIVIKKHNSGGWFITSD